MMKIIDILTLVDYDTIVSISEDLGMVRMEQAVINDKTPIDEYNNIIVEYGQKEVKSLKVDMTDTLTIIYKA